MDYREIEHAIKWVYGTAFKPDATDDEIKFVRDVEEACIDLWAHWMSEDRHVAGIMWDRFERTKALCIERNGNRAKETFRGLKMLITQGHIDAVEAACRMILQASFASNVDRETCSDEQYWEILSDCRKSFTRFGREIDKILDEARAS